MIGAKDCSVCHSAISIVLVTHVIPKGRVSRLSVRANPSTEEAAQSVDD